LYESYDVSTVRILSANTTLLANLALGTIKDMQGKSTFDQQLPATYELLTMANNTVVGNVAAGSGRLGYWLVGMPCAGSATTLAAGPAVFANNSAHSCLAGMVLQANNQGASCTELADFSTYLNWDFGLLTMKGITTDLKMRNIVAADNKHTSVLILRTGGFTEDAYVELAGALFVGQSEQDVCSMCAAPADAGCHQALSRQSYNKALPYGPAIGLQSSLFAIEFTSGPEKKPWDNVMGYPMVLVGWPAGWLGLADVIECLC
jgi:hypothetical protein